MIVRNDPGDSITELFSCEQLISESGKSQNTQTAWVYLQCVARAFIFLQQLFQLWLSNDEKAQFEMWAQKKKEKKMHVPLIFFI